MFRKLSAFILLTTSSCAVIYSQKSPQAPKQPVEKRAQTMVWTTPFDGGSYLGVQTQEVTRDNFAKYGLSEVRGVAVEKVLENSPAANAGVQDGDVIVRFESEEITSTRKLTRLLGEVAPDHQAKLTILRGGSEREITVTVGKRPTPKFENGAFEMRIPPMGDLKIPVPPAGDFKMTLPPMSQSPQLRPFPPAKPGEPNVFLFGGAGRQLGVSLTPLTPQLGEYFGVEEGKGLLINDVRSDSPAAKAGLKAGDIIIEIEGRETKGMVDLIRTLNDKKEGDVTLTIVRERNRQTVRVTPEKMQGEGFFYQFDNDGDGFKTIQPLPKMQISPQPMIAPAPLINFEAPKVIL